MKTKFLLLSLFMASSLLAQTKTTIVLVHGALFTGAGWARVQSQLQSAGRNVAVLDVPGRLEDGVDPKTITIDTATAKLCQVIAEVGGPVVLVGHSQGGALITQAVQACGDSIRALVYLAAVVPKNGETAFDGLNPDRDTNFGKCVEVRPDEGLFHLKKDGPLESSFFADLRAKSPALADWALAGMVSEPLGIGTTKLHFDTAKFEALPKYYIEALQDAVVSLTTQRQYQASTRFRQVFSLDTSHSAFLTLPSEVARILQQVAGETEKPAQASAKSAAAIDIFGPEARRLKAALEKAGARNVDRTERIQATVHVEDLKCTHTPQGFIWAECNFRDANQADQAVNVLTDRAFAIFEALATQGVPAPVTDSQSSSRSLEAKSVRCDVGFDEMASRPYSLCVVEPR